MTNEVMIDIETLDTGPRSVVLSIGAHTFEPAMNAPSSFMVTLKLDEQFAAGRTVSEGTLLFWTNLRETVAFDVSFKPANRWSVSKSLLALNAYLHNREAEVFWANSPNFDMTILESLYKDLHLTPFWNHRQLRDVRTLIAEAGITKDWKPSGWDPAEISHHPISDCRWQIAAVKEARSRQALRGMPRAS